MSKTKKTILGFLFVILLVIFFILGLLWNDFPQLEFNHEVKLYEIFSLLFTLAIGILIPLLIKKWIDDNRSIKISLVEEIKGIILTIEKIKKIVSDCHSCGSINKDNKDEINFLFHSSELQLTSLNEQLEISFLQQSKKIMPQTKEIYHVYKDFLTGGELMISTFNKVDSKFLREHNIEYSKIETHLKKIIHKIHKL